MFRAQPGAGGFLSDSPVPTRSDYADGSPGTSLSGPYQTRGRKPSGGVSTDVLGALPPS